jgi:hypothetical protein
MNLKNNFVKTSSERKEFRLEDFIKIFKNLKGGD